MLIVSAHGGGAKSIADRTCGGDRDRVLSPKMGLAPGAGSVAFDPGMVTTVDDVRTGQGHFPGTG